MIKLIVMRHGNNFDSGDTILRVGLRSDLPLSNSGRQQAHVAGLWFKQQAYPIKKVWCSQLQRTQQTARLALDDAGNAPYKLIIDQRFNELDYGIDDGQPEFVVKKRLGDALTQWEQHGTVPDGWHVDPVQIMSMWQDFLQQLVIQEQDDSSLNYYVVCTSNGVARFLPMSISSGSLTFSQAKLKTGGIGVLYYNNSDWSVEGWNITLSHNNS